MPRSCAAVSVGAASETRWQQRNRFCTSGLGNPCAVASRLSCVAPGYFHIATAELIVDRCKPRRAEIGKRLMSGVWCRRLLVVI